MCMLTNLLVTLRLTPKTAINVYVNTLVGDIKVNPKDCYWYTNSQRKGSHGIPPLKRTNGSGLAESDTEQAEAFNGQFTDLQTYSPKLRKVRSLYLRSQRRL